ncbi:bidirectional sugar transporter SWEET5-like [Impatiens glandulifera]|uniref:bidirectional sugar transporter SWEET5-like n=1 Tax=Impatiens glandulifera TaxID=253017 RepID=UPI001FB063E5|nr:bidirectional sugar transporter SWEET5-like [Impatiens glandulifera]
MVMSREAIRNIVGIIGNVISFFLFLSPLPTFLHIWKAKSVEEFKPDPYLATLLNCAMWVFYALPMVHPGSTLVGTINGIGLFIELIYVFFYFFFSNQKKRKTILVVFGVECFFVGIIVTITMYAFETTKRRSMLVGIVCVVLNAIMYASPLTVMRQVIRTKSVKYMPFWVSFANSINAVIWLAYALLKFDLYVTIPNGLGTLFGVMQLILYFTYYKSASIEMLSLEKDNENPTVIKMTKENDEIVPVEVEMSTK